MRPKATYYDFSKLFSFTKPRATPCIPNSAEAYLYYSGWTMAQLAKSELGAYWKASRKIDAVVPQPRIGWYSINLETEYVRSWGKQEEWGKQYGLRPLPALITASIILYLVSQGYGDSPYDVYSLHTVDKTSDGQFFQVSPTKGQKWKFALTTGEAMAFTGMAFGKFLS